MSLYAYVRTMFTLYFKGRFQVYSFIFATSAVHNLRTLGKTYRAQICSPIHQPLNCLMKKGFSILQLGYYQILWGDMIMTKRKPA